jgi:hypothetical protein
MMMRESSQAEKYDENNENCPCPRVGVWQGDMHGWERPSGTIK